MNQSVVNHKEKALSLQTKLRQRINDYYSHSTNPEDKANLNLPLHEVKTEFTLQIYKTEEGIIEGKVHQGESSYVPKRWYS
jgi:hypothetical protein